MFDALTTTRDALQRLAAEFEPATLTGEQAVRVVENLGVIHRLTEGLLAKAAKRVADTSAHERSGDRDAAQFYARAVGVEASEARRVIDTAKRLEQLPDTEAAVREGRLSARQAQLVAEAAAQNPAVERELLAAAGEGLVPLKDELPASERFGHRRSPSCRDDERLEPGGSANSANCSDERLRRRSVLGTDAPLHARPISLAHAIARAASLGDRGAHPEGLRRLRESRVVQPRRPRGPLLPLHRRATPTRINVTVRLPEPDGVPVAQPDPK